MPAQMPRKPIGAYWLFQKANREKLRDAETQEILAELGEHEAKFESWVNTVSVPHKEQIIGRHYKDHVDFREFNRYLKYVARRETVGGCTSCRRSDQGCVKCTTSKAQNYIMRHGKLPEWWRFIQHHLSGAQGIYIYIYISLFSQWIYIKRF